MDSLQPRPAKGQQAEASGAQGELQRGRLSSTALQEYSHRCLVLVLKGMLAILVCLCLCV